MEPRNFVRGKQSRVEIINLSGGIIGLLATNPRKAINARIEQFAAEGWYCHQITPYETRNLFMILLQLLILICTLGLWTFGAGFMLLMHKDARPDDGDGIPFV